jgi:uncharacterized protein YndB with AHSA1/START domain
MSTNPGTGTIERKVLIQASPEVIFRALTEAKEVAQWFCDRATSDPRLGGELRAYWRMGLSGQARRGRAIFTSLVPAAQVTLQWIDEGDGAGDAMDRHSICYLIHLRRGTSEVTVHDEGPPFADEESCAALGEGWISVLRDLKEHCEAKQRSSRRRPAGESEPT